MLIIICRMVLTPQASDCSFVLEFFNQLSVFLDQSAIHWWSASCTRHGWNAMLIRMFISIQFIAYVWWSEKLYWSRPETSYEWDCYIQPIVSHPLGGLAVDCPVEKIGPTRHCKGPHGFQPCAELYFLSVDEHMCIWSLHLCLIRFAEIRNKILYQPFMLD